MARADALSQLEQDAKLPGFELQFAEHSPFAELSSGWSAFLPGRIVIHGGQHWRGRAHELAHVVVAAHQGIVRPEPDPNRATEARGLWLLFNALADVFVDAELKKRGLLEQGHAKRASQLYADLAERGGEEFSPMALKPFLREHARQLWRDTGMYAAALEAPEGLRTLFEGVACEYFPCNVWTWLRLSDLRSGGVARTATSSLNRVDPAENPIALAEALAALMGSETPFGLLLWDIEALREINERYGRDTGDLVLASLSAALGRGLNARHFRQGGDEGLVLIPHASGVDLDRLLNRSLLAVEREAGIGVPVTVRLGMAFYPGDGRTLAELSTRLQARTFASTLNL